MEGRFSGIFEHLNQRNTEYYQKAFKKLEEENKTTFNFAAAFLPVMWLVFRKMYGWAMLLVLVNSGIQGILGALCSSSTARGVSSLILLLIIFVGFGFWGNSLYYKVAKSRIHKGYSEMANYNSIDPIGGMVIIGVVIPFLIGIISGILALAKVTLSSVVWLSPPVQVFFIAILWAINYKKCHAQESVEPVEITEESVNKYLWKANPKRLTVSVGVIVFPLILVLISIVAVAGMKVIGNKILHQLDKISEEMDKAPSNFRNVKQAKRNMRARNVRARMNRKTKRPTNAELSKLAKELEKLVEKKKNSSKVPEETVNQKGIKGKLIGTEKRKAAN